MFLCCGTLCMIYVVDNFFFVCKQKTTYEMRISDWSSDFFSSDLPVHERDKVRHGFSPTIGGFIGVGIGVKRLEQIRHGAERDLDRRSIGQFWQFEVSHVRLPTGARRSEEHTSELQSLMRISYAVFCLKKKIIIR